MPSMEELNVLAERLARVSGASRIYLFGSCARGEFSADSDIDLGFVFPDSVDSRRSLLAAHYELWPRKFAFDLVPVAQRDLERGSTRLAREISRQGVLLYEHDDGRSEQVVETGRG